MAFYNLGPRPSKPSLGGMFGQGMASSWMAEIERRKQEQQRLKERAEMMSDPQYLIKQEALRQMLDPVGTAKQAAQAEMTGLETKLNRAATMPPRLSSAAETLFGITQDPFAARKMAADEKRAGAAELGAQASMKGVDVQESQGNRRINLEEQRLAEDTNQFSQKMQLMQDQFKQEQLQWMEGAEQRDANLRKTESEAELNKAQGEYYSSGKKDGQTENSAMSAIRSVMGTYNTIILDKMKAPGGIDKVLAADVAIKGIVPQLSTLSPTKLYDQISGNAMFLLRMQGRDLLNLGPKLVDKDNKLTADAVQLQNSYMENTAALVKAIAPLMQTDEELYDALYNLIGQEYELIKNNLNALQGIQGGGTGEDFGF